MDNLIALVGTIVTILGPKVVTDSYEWAKRQLSKQAENRAKKKGKR